MKHATKNTAGCCDGTGQVHLVASDDPHYEGPLSSVTLCLDLVCMARRAAKWAQECGEEPEYVTCPVCHGHGLMQGDGSGWDGTAYHDPGCDFCQGGGAVPKHVALEYERTKRAASSEERP